MTDNQVADKYEWTPNDLARDTARTVQNVTRHIRRLRDSGEIQKTGGRWIFDTRTYLRIRSTIEARGRGGH